MGLTLAVDFGSTFTKVAAVDLDKGELVGVAQSSTTVDSDITLGLRAALDKLRGALGVETLDAQRIVSCSSAAGGLRMVVVGLVNELTTKAAREAALGAGAKLVGTYSYGLSPDDVRDIERIAPDLVLLTGGTDGGNEKVIIHNAEVLAASRLESPVIIAGNKMAAAKVQSYLEAGGKYAMRVENVLPDLHSLHVEPARVAIRNIFMQRITHAKGLDRAQELVGDIIMPTPMAVLRGSALLASGAGGEKGMGEVVVVDVGGATTDVYSVAEGYPSQQEGIIVKGLSEPYEKRTVEGDLGIRYNAHSILELAGSEIMTEKMNSVTEAIPQLDLEAAVKHLSDHVETLPQNEEDSLIDIGLASTAVDIATKRHAGSLEETYFPSGKAKIQRGKDLTGVECVVGTGGICVYCREPGCILASACFDKRSPESLRPLSPRFFVDGAYILYAAGLLADISAEKAVKVIKANLREVEVPSSV